MNTIAGGAMDLLGLKYICRRFRQVMAVGMLPAMLLAALPAKGQGQAGDFWYNLKPSGGPPTTAAIVRYSGPGGDVIIPGIIVYTNAGTTVSLPVTIGDGLSVFSSNTNVTRIILENGAVNINDFAFEDCVNLASISIPDTVTNIGGAAFQSCSNLISVTFGSGISTIGAGAFQYCTSLPNISLPDSCNSIGNGAFNGCTDLVSVDTGNGVTAITMTAFEHCTSLTNVTIGINVTNISNNAFDYCSSLVNIVIPKNVTSIGDYAFGDCNNLTGIYFLGNAPSITMWSFWVYYKATAYYLPGTTGWNHWPHSPPAVLWDPSVLTITSQPISQTNVVGSTAAFNVTIACEGVHFSGPLIC